MSEDGSHVTEEMVDDLTGPEIVPGHRAGARRLIEARGSIYAAFDSLALGFDHAEAVGYLMGSPHMTALATNDSKQHPCPVHDTAKAGRIVGLCMGFALTCVEAALSVSPDSSRWRNQADISHAAAQRLGELARQYDKEKTDWIKLFNRLDAAVARYINQAQDDPEGAFDALVAAHDRVLKAAADMPRPNPQEAEC